MLAAKTRSATRFSRVAVAFFFLCVGCATVRAEQMRRFDIPAQPLSKALAAFVKITGAAVATDTVSTNGLISSRVKGALTHKEALAIMAAGTGLKVIELGTNSYSLTHANAAAATLAAATKGEDHSAYFAKLQRNLERTLCTRADTRPGLYKAAIQLFLARDGKVRAAHLVASSGNQGRDDAVLRVLEEARVPSPPPSLAQPVTVFLDQQRVAVCPAGGR